MAMIFTHLLIGLVLGISALKLGSSPIIFFMLVFGSVFPDLDVLVGEHRRTLHHISLYTVLFFTSGLTYLSQPNTFLLAIFSASIGLVIHCLIDYYSPFRVEDTKKKVSIYSHYHNSYLRGSSFINTARFEDLIIVTFVGSGIMYISSKNWIIAITIISIILSYSYSIYIYKDQINISKSKES